MKCLQEKHLVSPETINEEKQGEGEVMNRKTTCRRKQFIMKKKKAGGEVMKKDEMKDENNS